MQFDNREFKDYFGDNPVEFILTRRSANEDKYLDSIDRYVERNARGITTSQLRNIFAYLKNINKSNLNELKMLRIKLAYIAGRNERSRATRNLCTLLDALIQKVNESNLEIFKDFFEAIICYHKYY